MMPEKHRGQEIVYRNERRSAFVTYNRWSMGQKYAVYAERGGIKSYCTSFDSIIEATRYCNMIY